MPIFSRNVNLNSCNDQNNYDFFDEGKIFWTNIMTVVLQAFLNLCLRRQTQLAGIQRYF